MFIFFLNKLIKEFVNVTLNRKAESESIIFLIFINKKVRNKYNKNNVKNIMFRRSL